MTGDEILYEAILYEAIEKAERNGWDGEDLKEQLTCGYSSYTCYWVSFYIFSHDFAIAFWGEELIEQECSVVEIPAWQYHLQQMVLKEEPIKYLGKFL